MPLIETKRTTLHIKDYRQANTERPVTLLIHGAGSDYESWPSQLRRLPEANAIAVDLAGHGQSPEPGRESITEYAADIVALLDALNLESVIAAGHSMGGAIAQQLALDYEERIKALFLAGTGAYLEVNPGIIEGIVAETQSTAERIVKRMWAEDTSPDILTESSESLLQVPPSIIQADYRACDNFDVRQRLSEIAVPTLVIGADSDKMVPFKRSENLAEAIPNTTLVQIANAGHMFMLEQPETVTEHVRTWLKSINLESR